MRVGLIGGVKSSAITLQKLCEHNVDVVGVFGYQPKNTALVSGYYNLETLCQDHNMNFTPFTKINEHIEQIQDLELDFLLVVGISQLVSADIIKSAKLGAIGFHPTKLPEGRGRAPLAWLVHEAKAGAATFFMLETAADAGAIVAQECFDVNVNDTAQSVETKIYTAMSAALDTLIPQLIKGQLTAIEQDETLATEFGIRRPEDGLIEWSRSAYEIDRVIKAASAPHPGAFTYLESEQIEVLSSRVEKELKIQGVQGRILKTTEQEVLVQTGAGTLWVTPDSNDKSKLKVGKLLGYKVDLEIYELKKQIAELKELIKG